MNEQLFWFSLIVGVTLFGVAVAMREGMRQESREQFWREHINKYNNNKGDK